MLIFILAILKHPKAALDTLMSCRNSLSLFTNSGKKIKINNNNNGKK